MDHVCDPATIGLTEPAPGEATVVRTPSERDPRTERVESSNPPAPPVPGGTDETLVRNTSSGPPPVVSTGSAGFAEEVRLLLRSRLLIAHATVGFASGIIALCGLSGIPVMPAEAGMGPWAVGMPVLVFGQCAAGLVLLARRPGAPIGTLRFVEVSHFGTIALAGIVGRFVVLNAPAAPSPDPRFAGMVYRFDAILTNYPIVFSVVLYGVVIPNTRRRSLIGAGLLCGVPVVATVLAAAVNADVRPHLPAILPGGAVPLFMAGAIAVFCATRANDLRRQAFEAKREAQQLGAYTLRRKLGEGGMGEVWLAEHRLLKRPCAMKFIRAELAAEATTAVRFEREVNAVTALTHPNTVRIFDYGRGAEGTFYYVMEYLDGPTLDRLVRDRGPLDPGRAVHLLRQLCGALAEAHAAGMVHRDLKPGNVIVATLGGQRDVAKLLDFGLVQDYSATASDDRITRAGTVLGTPSYMCPEQAAGEAVDPRGDVYSLGAVAFFMLTGRPPFEGANVGRLLAAHLAQPAPDVRSVRPQVPDDLASVVAKCLEKKADERFQTARELAAALAGCACAAAWDAQTVLGFGESAVIARSRARTVRTSPA